MGRVFASWLVFEETIVDRHGLWRSMPQYGVGDPWLWDAVIALVTIIGSIVASWCRLRCCQLVVD